MASALLAGAGTTASAAQDPGDEVLEEVVVTAQFREQSVQDTPLSITAVSAEMLEARSQTNIAEVATQAPSVTLRQAAPMFGPSVQTFIRGIGQLDFNPALEPGVGMYVDDVYFATLTGSLLDLLDLERVEILRGPQGTLAGKNSIGGAVKLYSRRPTGDNEGFVSATYGSRDRVDLRASANFALTDNLFLRVSGVNKRQDGYIDRIDYGCAFPGSGIGALRTQTAGCLVARDSNVSFSAVRGTLRWLASDDLEFSLSVDYTDDDRNPTGAVLVDANTIPNANMQPVPGATNLPLSNFIVPHGSYYTYASYQSPSNPWVGNLPVLSAYDTSYVGETLGVTRDYILRESRPIARQFFKGGGTSLTADWNASDALSLKSITAWRWYDSGFVNDNDLSPLTSSIGAGTLPFHSFSQELRLNGALGSALDWTLGGFYMRQASRYESWQDLRYNGQANSYVRDVTGASADAKRNPLQFQQNDPVRAETWAAFAHASWHITDAFAANLGVRYTDESKSYTFVRQNADGTPQTFIGALDGQPPQKYSGDRVDYRANLQYDWTPNFMTYVQYATGFKGGGVSPRPFVIAQAVPFGPETLATYELGAKSDLFGRRLRLNGSVYFGKYKDIQLSLQSCPQFGAGVPCGAWANAGNGEVKGVELEAVWRPVAGLQFDGAYNYFDFEYTFIDPAALPQPPAVPRPWNITEDDTLPFAPKKKWSLGVQYEFPLAAGGTIAPRVDYAYQGGFFTNGANQPSNRIKSYELLNARVTWRSSDGSLDVGVEGTNLTDKYYFLSRADQLQAAGHTDGVPGRPREYAVTIKKRFF